MSGSRYLSKIEKAVELREWHDKSSSPGIAPGDPDEAIVPWCKLINHIPGICTLQSCTGHRRANGYVETGHLWLKLSETMALRFYKKAMNLSAQHCIERVSTIYSAWGSEIVEIVFHGSERSTLDLDHSLTTILRFLQDLH